MVFCGLLWFTGVPDTHSSSGSGAARSGGQLTPSVRGGGQCYISDPSPNNPWHVVTLILLCRTKAGWSHGEQLWSLRDVVLRFRSSVEEDIFLPKMHENAGFRPKIFIFFCGATADPWCGRGSDAVPHRPTSQRIRSDIPAFLRLHL